MLHFYGTEYLTISVLKYENGDVDILFDQSKETNEPQDPVTLHLTETQLYDLIAELHSVS